MTPEYTLDRDVVKKFKYREYALLAWLFEDPQNRFAIETTFHGIGYTSKNLHFYVVDREKENVSEIYGDGHYSMPDADREASRKLRTDFEFRLGGKFSSIDIFSLSRCGLNNFPYVNRFNSDKLKDTRLGKALKIYFDINVEDEDIARKIIPSSDYNQLIYVNKPMAHWWKAEGYQTYLSLKEKRDEKLKSAERYIIIGRPTKIQPIIHDRFKKMFPEGFDPKIGHLTVMRPWYYAKVTKETGGRLYVKDIVEFGKNSGSAYESGEYVLQGRAPNQYVEKQYVMSANATEEKAENFSALDLELIEDWHRQNDRWLEAHLPALLSLYNERIQSAAMRDDMFRELDQKTSAAPTPK